MLFRSVYISAADIRFTPDAPLGLNSSPPRPEYRPRGTETILNQRYYEVGRVYGYNYSAGAGNYRVAFQPFRSFKRNTPAVNVSNITYGGGVNTLVVEQVSPTYFGARVTSTGASTFICDFDFEASSEL